MIIDTSASVITREVIRTCSQTISPKHKLYAIADRCDQQGIRYRMHMKLRKLPERYKYVRVARLGFKKQALTAREYMTAEVCPSCPYSLVCQTTPLVRTRCRPACSKPIAWLVQEIGGRGAQLLELPDVVECPAPADMGVLCPTCVEESARNNLIKGFQDVFSRRISHLSELLCDLLKTPRTWEPMYPKLGHILDANMWPWAVVENGWYRDE